MSRRVVLMAVVQLVFASSTHAQTLRDQVRQLFTFGNCGEIICLFNLQGFHGQHFKPSAESAGRDFISFVSSSVAGNEPRFV